MKTFTFNGVSSDTFGLYINGAGVFDSPQPDLDYVPVPGRNGDLIYDNGRFNNIDISYSPVFATRNFRQTAKAFQAWLLSHKGYYRLTDDYHPEYFRLASAREAIEVGDIDWVNDAGSMEVVFNCKPQLYLVSGEETVTLENFSMAITNPTRFTAKPLIRVYGYGQVIVGDVTFTVLSTPTAGYIDIDCELMNCTSDLSNANDYVQIDDYFPTLAPGSNSIFKIGANLTKVEVTPRWWTI